MSFQGILENYYSFLDELVDVNFENEHEVLESLKLSFKIRHNFIHHMLAFYITSDFSLFKEKKLMDIFAPSKMDKFGRLTPDMCFGVIDGVARVINPGVLQAVDSIVFCDISVSTRRNQQELEKIKKYKPALNECLESLNLPLEVSDKSIVHVFALRPDLTNLEKEVYDFSAETGVTDYRHDFPFADIRLFCSSLISTQALLKRSILNESLIKNFFLHEFGDNGYKDEEDGFFDIIKDRLPSATEGYMNIKKENKSTEKKLKNCFENIKKRNKEKLTNPIDMTSEDKDMLKKYTRIYGELLDDEDIIGKFSEKDTQKDKIMNSVSILEKDALRYSTKKIKPTHHIFTPICHDFFFSSDQSLNKPNIFQKTEQNQIYRMVNILCKHLSEESESYSFIRDIKVTFDSIIDSPSSHSQKQCFDNNCWQVESSEITMRTAYHLYREECLINKSPVKSYLDFYSGKNENQYVKWLKLANHDFSTEKMLMPKESETRVYKQKMLKIQHSALSEQSLAYWKKGHSGLKDEKKVKLNETEYSSNFEHVHYIDNFLDLLTEQTRHSDSITREGLAKAKKHTQFYDFCMEKNDADVNTFNFLKDEMRKEFKPILSTLERTNGFKYLETQSLAAEQLMHFTQFSLPSNTYSFITTGAHNLLIIVNNSYHDAGKDVGKSFMVVGYCTDTRWISPVFGKVETTKYFSRDHDQEFIFFSTNWRRLETFKLTFLRDQFYSVMSTSMNALLRHKKYIIGYQRKDNEKDYAFDLVRHHFSLKALVACTSNQRIAEMLADMRYAIMASFSDFSEIEQLILDKFCPKYHTVFESWIAHRCYNLAKQVEDFNDKENIRTFFKQPVFSKGKRKDESIGGKFELPSIWTGTVITDLQDLLDDMFIYVHTLKEPSNIHHENIKAMETIIEYQKKYDSISEKRKHGDLDNFQDIKEFLMDSNPIGHVSDLVTLSARSTMDTVGSLDLNSRAKKHFFEKVSNITSTKAAIPEYEREIHEVTSKKKKKKKRQKDTEHFVGDDLEDNHMKKLGISKLNYIAEFEKVHNMSVKPKLPETITTAVSKESFLPRNNRSKVHDCILDVMESNVDLATVFDVAEWNMTMNNARVVADICIKAQYGAKREFYVINVGAKCNARILENIFSEVCKVIPNEMISVPGDKKMLTMQNFINEALIKKGSNQQVVFVNGDCTKWSAAETMECFMSLIVGMSDFLSEDIIRYMLCVVCMWSNKKITIPQSILQNTFFTIDDKTEYLAQKTPVFLSEQNFLQGMFNYMSSFKAVCCSNLTRKIWASLYPSSTLKCEHLEHSDDYSLLIISEDLEEVRKFRTLHRIMMKSHGFNDSVKKTNTQRFLMEFISLVSLNGHMTYPHIKKLKECGMNLGCTGFRDDVDGAMSRVGESVRVGTVMCSSFFMQRCHLYNLARSYSILPGQRNCSVKSLGDVFRLPVEFFGLPDTHPILSFLTKGLANNYRLLNYSKNDGMQGLIPIHVGSVDTVVSIDKLLMKLTEIEMILSDEKGSLNSTDFTQGMRLFHPHYTFDIENKLIRKLRDNVRMTKEESDEFWLNHMTYNFIKPQCRSLLMGWMRAMYFKHNFSLAYSRNSRAQITLRLSNFTSSNCMIPFYSTEEGFNMKTFSIRDYLEMLCQESSINLVERFIGKEKLPKDPELISKTLRLAILNCDASVSTVYSMMENSRCIYDRPHTRSTVATLTPTQVNWLTLDNKPDSLIQYIFNFADFLKDNRVNKGLPSLEADKMKIEKIYGKIDESNCQNINLIKSVYTDIILSQNKRNLCMTYASKIQNIEEFLRTHLEFGTNFSQKYSVFTSGATESINPHTGELYYKRLYTFTRNECRLLIDDSALIFSLMKHGYKMDDEMIKRILLNIRVKSDFEADQRLLMTSEEMWQTKTVDDLKTMGCSNNELKTFAFLKSYIYNDVGDIMSIINQDFAFDYTYHVVDPWMTPIVKESVEFGYSNSSFRCLRLVNDKLIIITDSKKKFLLSDAYLIAMKLMNLIRLFDLEHNFGQKALWQVQAGLLQGNKVEIPRNVPPDHNNLLKSILSEYKVEGYFEFDELTKSTRLKTCESDELDSITLENIFFFSEHVNSENILQHDTINKRVNIDYETMSVFNGRRKVFSLPLLSCQQSNTTEVINDLELNGLTLNWWLDSGRIKSLLKKEDISIHPDIFDKLQDFYLKDERWIINAEITRVLAQLKNLPNKLFHDVPDEVFETIQRRLLERDDSGINKFDAVGFIRNLKIKECGSPEIEKEPEKDPIDVGDTSVNDAEPEFSFSMDMEMELDDMLGDLDDVMFTMNDENSDDDMDDVTGMILDKGESSGSSSKDSMINFADFHFLQPTFVKEETFLFSGTRTKTLLEEIGDPTKHVIKKMFGTQLQIDHLSIREKIGLLYRINEILLCTYVISDAELMLSVILASRLLATMSRSEEWKLIDDFVCFCDDDITLNLFMRYDGELDLANEAIILNSGGLKRERRKNSGLGSGSIGSQRSDLLKFIPKQERMTYYLVPLTQERKLEILNKCSETFTIHNFLGVNILYKCYERLFHENFVRTGFVLQLIKELT